MAIVHDSPQERSRLSRALTSDFCPWANRFVYWLKEPVGWFVLAFLTSCLIGLYFDPVGWTIAGALALMISAGIAWPLVAISAIKVELHPDVDAVNEGSDCDMVVSVRNRLPLPVWGLVVEGYLDANPDDSEDALPTAALASVPAWCRGDYRIRVSPELRGHYPLETPKVACSFPFAIWTARKPMTDSSALTVHPKVYPLAGESAFSDRARSEVGTGSRKGNDGDFVGLRQYRLGDSIKQVNWIATARTDSLMVTERGAPETAAVEIWVDTQIIDGGSQRERVSELNDRMRVAASLIASLHKQNVPFRVQVGGEVVRESRSHAALISAFDLLAGVPQQGAPCRRWQRGKTTAWISVSGCRDETSGRTSGHSNGETIVQLCNPKGVLRSGTMLREARFCVGSDLSDALHQFWWENGHGQAAA